MEVVYEAGDDNLAKVYIGRFQSGKYVEFVESVQPPNPKEKKFVLIISTLFGCPVGCLICDAGRKYNGKLTADEIFSQIDFLVDKNFRNRNVNVEKFKIQFSRMGEPALNSSVLNVLKEFNNRYNAPGFIPSISSVAPAGSELFFEELLDIKNSLYNKGNFQLQFSIHTTSATLRDRMIPVRKWNFKKIADYGTLFYSAGDRKITLNFALSEGSPLDAGVLKNYFNPEIFLIKITPVNPTVNSLDNNISSAVSGKNDADNIESVIDLRNEGYEVIISIGELEENKIGSNCGQYLETFLKSGEKILNDSYSYKVKKVIV